MIWLQVEGFIALAFDTEGNHLNRRKTFDLSQIRPNHLYI